MEPITVLQTKRLKVYLYAGLLVIKDHNGKELGYKRLPPWHPLWIDDVVDMGTHVLVRFHGGHVVSIPLKH